MSSTPTSTGMPKQIGPYRIEREIARGGMGIVYLARDTRLDRWVAIKALPDDVAADRDRLARFEREAKTLASLNHPNVAGIYTSRSSTSRAKRSRRGSPAGRSRSRRPRRSAPRSRPESRRRTSRGSSTAT